MESDTYVLVHPPASADWEAITISGDGIFRVHARTVPRLPNICAPNDYVCAHADSFVP